ncbi:hypothetical protein BDY24DRAFT_393336 [Mrakia frigida]|uniref:uncharacterized protein n=1 Tax=Mrakia frigida TaxID=29902 RepID=UPI003FCC0C54
MTVQDKHKKAASAKWKKAQVQSGKTPEPTKPPAPSTSTRPSRPLHLDNPLPSGKQDSDDSEEDDNVEEEEGKRDDSDGSDDASGSRFRRRQLVSNQARYEEKDDVVIPGEEEESDGEASHELEQLTAFMARQRLALESSSSSSPLTPAASSILEDDIDHSLRGLGSGSSARRTTKEKSQVRVGEGSLVEMSAERAKADALSDVKARLLAGRDSGAKRRTGRVEVSKKPASSKTPSHQADDVDDFLDLIS